MLNLLADVRFCFIDANLTDLIRPSSVRIFERLLVFPHQLICAREILPRWNHRGILNYPET